jgi:drug/metabolite transporter (DMT)-like permease
MVRKHWVAVGLTLTVILDTVVQLLWKFSVTRLPATLSLHTMVYAALHQPWFLALIVVAFLQFANWLIVLERADLSFAKPVSALSYVTVCLASAYLFKEHVGALKAFGIVCVLAGIWLLGTSAAKSEAAP